MSAFRQAAALHDVGKVAVPDALLRKPGELTAEEFEQVKTHAAVGGAILAGSTSEVLRAAEEIARRHDECWEGSGYPSGLVSEEIPLRARIAAVADVFDAISHARRYKPAWPVEQALDEIQGLSGCQFDPQVVSALREVNAHQLARGPRRKHLTAVA